MRNLIVWLFCLIFASGAAFGQTSHSDSAITAAEKAYSQGQYREAESQFVRAEKEAESFGPFDHRLAMTLNNLAGLYVREGKHKRARKMADKANAMRNREASPS